MSRNGWTAAVLCALISTVAPLHAGSRRAIDGTPPAPAGRDRGAWPAADRIESVRFVLALRDRAGLEALIAAQQDSRSPEFRRWRDATELADRFAARRVRYERLRRWLSDQGLEITHDSPLRLAITVAGTTAQFEAALATRLHATGDGSPRGRIAIDRPSLPAEIAPDVAAIVGLEAVEPYRPAIRLPDSTYALGPADFSLAYDAGPLAARGLTGAGVTIAVVARSDYLDADVDDFRTRFLPGATGTVSKLFSGANPGILASSGNIEEKEVLLDTQWAGAMAPGATVETVVGGQQGGVVESLQASVEAGRADLISFSFALCEGVSSHGNSFLVDALYALANAQGQTVLVAAGDNGAADCPNSEAPAVNVLASSPHAIAVGGTALQVDVDMHGFASAVQSEVVWNDGGGATGGGVSELFALPRFQRVAGVSGFGSRGIPDLAVAASPITPGYVLVRRGVTSAIGGTSASTPALAGALALAVQQSGRLGQALPAIYQIGSRQAAGQGPTVFRDVVTGSNGGFPATPGYDLASGWGAPSITALADALAATTAERCSPQLDCLVPATGQPARRCGVQWQVAFDQLARRAPTAGYPVGAPRPDQVCHDGDPGCDRDGTVNGACTVELSLCLNVNDPRDATSGHAPRCKSALVNATRVLQPRTGAAAASLAAVAAGLNLPSDLADECTEPALVTIPVGDKPHAFVARAKRAGGPSTARLRLRCVN